MRARTVLTSVAGLFALVSCSSMMAPQSTGPQSQASPSLHPELIVTNATVVTADDRFSIHQAFAVRDGKFLVVGNNERVRALAGSATRIVDAGGRTVLPGLIDSHI